MTLQQIEKARLEAVARYSAFKKETAKNEEAFKWEFDELARKKSMALDSVDLKRIEHAEHVLSIRGSVKLCGDDVAAVKDVIIELASNGGKKLFGAFRGTKDYCGFSHQGVGWMNYGYGPRHGYIVFAVGFSQAFRKHSRDLTSEEINDSIYLLEMLLAGKYQNHGEAGS